MTIGRVIFQVDERSIDPGLRRFTSRTLLLCIALLLLPQTLRLPFGESPRTYYVAPHGDDSNSGATPDAPLRTIQLALDRAGPGDRVELAAGDYYQDLHSRRDGAPGAPITLAGPQAAVIRGAGNAYIIEVNHDYITLEGFRLDGLWGDPGRPAGYRNKLLYVIGTEPGDGVTGLRVLRMQLANAGGECLRLRYFANHNEIAYSSFSNCGVHDFRFGDAKNGEGVYIGTARGQIDDGKNPTVELDGSAQNWVHHNTFDTQGNECVDIKEGATENIIEHNSCTGQRDAKSAGISVQGDHNVVRYNRVFSNVGAGVRLGGDRKDDGVSNTVYGNAFSSNQGGINIRRAPQGPICGNQMADSGEPIMGIHAGAPDPQAPCSG
jgi:hypothetical protein